MSTGSGFWWIDNNLLFGPLYIRKFRDVFHNTLLEYIETDICTDPNLLNFETEEFTKLPSKLKPSLLLDVILLKEKESTIRNKAEKKQSQDAYIKM